MIQPKFKINQVLNTEVCGVCKIADVLTSPTTERIAYLLVPHDASETGFIYEEGKDLGDAYVIN